MYMMVMMVIISHITLAHLSEVLAAVTKTGCKQKKNISTGENKRVQNSAHGSIIYLFLVITFSFEPNS